MTAEQELVVTGDEAAAQAEEKDTANPYGGGGGAENLFATVNSIENGDWDTAGLSAMSLGIDAVGLLTDPLGSLASWGVGWLIEHVWFLSEPFNALMGDPNAISGMAGTWKNVGEEIKATADEYRRAASGTTEWEGKAGEAYRKLAADLATSIEALGAAGKGMKGAVEGAGTVVGAVRGIVRDLIAGAVGEIAAAALRWLAASVATAGIAIGGAIAAAVRIALKWADKISGWMQKLAESIQNLSKHLDKLGSAATSVRKGIDEFFTLLSNPPSGNITNVSSQKALTQQGVEEAAGKINRADLEENNFTSIRNGWRGFKAGGADFKPWQQGDLFQPHLTAAADGGATKLATDTVKEYGKLDDGEKEQKQNKEEQ